MLRRYIFIIDDPKRLHGAPGLREHHAQREIAGSQWICVAYGDADTFDFLESAGATILDESTDAQSDLPAGRTQKLAPSSQPQTGERVHQMLKRITGGFDVRKF